MSDWFQNTAERLYAHIVWEVGRGGSKAQIDSIKRDLKTAYERGIIEGHLRANT